MVKQYRDVVKSLALIGLLSLFISCNRTDDQTHASWEELGSRSNLSRTHVNDGLYVDVTLGMSAWVINGDEVTVYTMNQAHTVKIEHHDGYVKANGFIYRIVRDSVSRQKSLVAKGYMDLVFKQVSTRTDISELEILDMVSSMPVFGSESSPKEKKKSPRNQYSVESPKVEGYRPAKDTATLYEQKAKWEPK